MEKTIEMLVEYILEENTAYKTEIRRLEKEVAHLTEQNDRLYEDVAKNADKLAKLTKYIRQCITWDSKDGRPYLPIYDSTITEEICNTLRIQKDDKTAV